MNSLGESSKAFLSSYLSNVRLEGFNSAYVIGTFDKKKTVATQQQRASVLALAAAQEHPENSKSIAVVGGGFAGISCAATLLKLGYSVSIFEQNDRLIPIQARCSDRFLHPSLYDWPDYKSDDQFGMSGITWTPNYAREVTQQTLESFYKITNHFEEKYDPNLGIRIEQIEQEDDSSISLYSEKRQIFRDFSAVFLAVGFGFEKPVRIGNRIRRYWENSALDHIYGRIHHPAKILVSGAGDGGLISVLNCAFRDFDHQKLHVQFEEFLSNEIIENISTIEKEIKRSERQNKSVNIIELYDNGLKKYMDQIRPNLKTMMSSETEVTFNSHLQSVFTSGSSAINRVLVYFLMRTNLIDFIGEKLDPSMVTEDDTGLNLEHIIQWQNSQNRFDHLIVRHGVSDNHFVKTFPNLDKALPDKFVNSNVLALEDAIPSDIKLFLTNL